MKPGEMALGLIGSLIGAAGAAIVMLLVHDPTASYGCVVSWCGGTIGCLMGISLARTENE